MDTSETPGRSPVLNRRSALIVWATSVGWAALAGAITLAAGLGGIQVGPDPGVKQFVWVGVATALSMLLTGTKAVLDARCSEDEEARTRELRATVARIDDHISSDQDQKTRALLARVILTSARALVELSNDPGRFDDVVESLVRSLCLIVRETRRLQKRDLRVFLLEVPPDFTKLSPNNVAGFKCTHCHNARQYPLEPSFRPTDSFLQEIDAVMMRRHPYQSGFLVDDRDDRGIYPERHTLEPPEPGITSFIRVGVPGFGVMAIDNWAPRLLEPADREICLAFADLIALARRTVRDIQLERDPRLEEVAP